jgi:hypothetical protein
MSKGIAMAKRKKRAGARKTKARRTKPRAKARKLVGKRAAPKKTKKAAKKLPAKRRLRSKERIHAHERTQLRTPVVQDTIIDVVDEPVPGVVRVTEIEDVSVVMPESEEENGD